MVQKSPSIWGDRLIFEAGATPISTTVSSFRRGNIAYIAIRVDCSAYAQAEMVPFAEDVNVAATIVNGERKRWGYRRKS